jgi:hypothetical protein
MKLSFTTPCRFDRRMEERMKRYIIGGAVVLAFAFGVLAKSHEGEFTWYRVGGAGNNHVVVISGHGKTCYVFTEETAVGQPASSTLLWCDSGISQP